MSEVEAKGVSNAEAFQAGQVCSAMAALLAASKRLIEMDEVIDLPEVNFDPGVSVEEHQLVELDQRREGTSALARLKDLVRKNRLMYGIVCPGELLDIMLQSKLRLEAGLNAWDAGWTEGLAAAEEDGPVISENGRLLQAMAQLIRSNFERLKKKDCQFDFYGKEHLWILKPGTSSRGRGIEVFARLDKILSRRSENRKVPWIVQKYMENSLLVRGRKFDIRQWVSETSPDTHHRLEPADGLVLRGLLRALRLPKVHL